MRLAMQCNAMQEDKRKQNCSEGEMTENLEENAHKKLQFAKALFGS